ncbi:MAG: hypothetical protein ACFFD8_05290 [Candidatus Thorarchaeota archaeon]
MASWHPERRKKVFLCFVISLLSICTIVAQPISLNSALVQTRSDLSNTRIAVVGFHERQSNNNGSARALQCMFEWMNASVEVIDGLDIQNGLLPQFDLVVFPAANPNAYFRELTPLGIERVRQFVMLGGSLFSICRGTEFVVHNLGLIEVSLNLCGPYGVVCFDEHHHDGVEGKSLSEMIVNRNSSGPDLSNEPDSYRLFAVCSSYFNWSAGSSIIPIMSYADSGLPGMIVFRFGAGTAFLSSPHPEFEEGNNRDGITDYDYLNDTDSEWNLLQQVSSWLINASPDVPVGLWIGATIGISIAILVTGIYYVFKVRRQKR